MDNKYKYTYERTADYCYKGTFDFKYLKNIHKYLFQDVYRWLEI